MKAKFKNRHNRLAIFAFIVFLFSMFKVWVAFSMSNFLVPESVSVLSKSETLDEGSVSISGNKVLSEDVKFHKVGDYITYSVKIKNEKNENYTLKSISDDNKNEYISYYYDSYKDIKLNSGESFDFVFTQEYTQEVEDMQKRDQNFSVNFYMVLKPEKKGDNNDDDDTEEKVSFIKNPSTGDHMGFYIALAVISLVLSILIFRRTGIRKVKKVGILLFALFVALYFAFLPQMAKGLEGQTFKLVHENSAQLKDKLLVFYDVDGTVNNKIVPYDTKVSIDDPYKEGYTFKGWRTDEGALFDIDTTPIKDDINLTAIFEADVYSIDYDLDGGQADNPTEYTIEDEVHINDPTRTGYDFTGWKGTDLSDLTKNLVIPKGSMGDRDYKAYWEASDYTVVFDSNTGTGSMDSITLTYDSSSYLPANKFTKSDSKFFEWNTKADGSGTSYKDEAYVKNLTDKSEITLYAQWTSPSDWAMFKDGRFVNQTMKQLAGTSGASYQTQDNHIVSIERSLEPPPSGATVTSVKSIHSPSELDMWYDSGTIYYYSPARYIYLNSDSQNIFGYFDALASIDYNGFRTDEVKNMSGMFSQTRSLKNVDLRSFNTSKVTNMADMFNQCNGAEIVDVSNFDTRKVTDMNHMFTGCTSITSLDLSGFITSNVRDMSKMFDYLPLVENIEVNHFDTSKVMDMSGMFRDCPKLRALDLSSFDTRNVTNMEGMFGCSYPLRVEYSGITSIVIGPKFETGKVTSMKQMFYNCQNLKSFSLRNAINDDTILFGFDTHNVTNMEGMFSDCIALKSIDLSSFDTRNVTNMVKMFKNTASLTTIYASDKFGTGSVTSGADTFKDDINLVGGSGTTYNSGRRNYVYARIDGGETSPGYFTRKT